MKKLLLILICMFFLNGCFANTKFLIFGVDIKEMKGKDFGVATLGALTAIGTHIAGHHIAAKVFDVDMHQHGLREPIDYSNNPSSSDIRWAARGGFVLQVAINTALAEFATDSYFTKGFTATTCAQLLTYNYRHPDEGDFYLIDENNGNGDLEHGLFTALSAYNFYKISFKEEQVKEGI